MGIHKTSIGGQAVIEGIMMRGPKKTAIAVRKPDKEIEVKVDDNASFVQKYKLNKIPIVRGCVSFIESMVTGMKSLTYSAEFADIEGDEGEEPSKFEKWLTRTFGDKLKDVLIYFSVIIALIFSIGLFIVLPTFLVSLLGDAVTDQLKTIIAGVVKISLFVGYILLVSQMNDIKRVFMYHGAEHKTIHCYESGEELTVENIRKHTRLHPRCGTSFLLIVMIISIIVFSFFSWDNVIVRIGLMLLMLPAISGVSYEIIKLAGKYDNWLTRGVSYPGLMLQYLTTREPTDDMLEVAIAAVSPVIPENKDEDKW